MRTPDGPWTLVDARGRRAVKGRLRTHAHERLRERQRTTITRFEQRYARTPTSQERAAMAMFPRGYKNPRGTHAVSYTWFHGH